MIEEKSLIYDSFDEKETAFSISNLRHIKAVSYHFDKNGHIITLEKSKAIRINPDNSIKTLSLEVKQVKK